jgi:hypothetical protein
MQASKLAPAASAVALAALSALAVLYATHVPATVPASAPSTMFSGDRAMVDVVGLARSPSVVGQGRNAMAREYIETQLGAAAIPFTEQRTVGVGTRYDVAGPVTNVVVRLPGSQPGGPAVLLMAHYDAVPMSPGAGDDGSGCAVLLETLRALRAGPRLKHDVIALFTDGEEAGLLGAAAFVREHPWARDVAVVMNFEARGTNGPSLMFETGAGNLDGVRALRHVRGARSTSLSTAVYRKMPNDTDLSEFMVLGVPALNFAFIGGVERYHTAEDDVAHIDPRSVQHHGNSALALTRAFADGELPRPRTSDAVFFDFPLLGVVVYPEAWALVFAAVALGLAAMVLLRARARSPRFARGAVVGFVLTLVSAVVAALCAAAVAALLQRAHGSSPSGGNPTWSGVYGAAFVLMAFSLATAGYAIARRLSDAPSVTAGVLLFWAVLSLIVTVTFRGASFAFTWPVIAMSLVLLVRERWAHWSTGIAMWIGVAVVAFIIAPIVYVMACVALGLDVPGAVILGLLTALATWLVSPVIDGMGGARLSRVPIGAAIAALVLFCVGAVTVRTTATHPGAAGLIYAVDADSNTAWLTGYATSPSAKRAVLGVLRHAAEGRRGSRQPPAWVGRSFGDTSIIEVPSLGPPPPRATVLSDATVAGARRASLRITPGIAHNSVYVSADAGLIDAASVDGKPIDPSRFRSRRWTLRYLNPPDSGFTLNVTLTPGAHGIIALRGVALGIPPSPAFRLPRRPEHILPVQNGDMTWVYTRVPF